MNKTISPTAIMLFLLVSVQLIFFQTEQIFIFFSSVSFVILLSYLFLDMSYRIPKDIAKSGKLVLVIMLIAVFIIVPIFLSIDLRITDNDNDNAGVHDGIVQTEEAIKFIFAGKNFYTEDYTNTPLANFYNNENKSLGSEDNQKPHPTLYHYIYLPFYVLISAPFYAMSNILFDWYDQRIVLLLALGGVIFLFFKKKGIRENALFATVLFTFNPAAVVFFINGRNDIFIIFLIVLTVYLLAKKKLLLSSIPLALACVSKHTAWLLLPFYWWFIYFEMSGQFETLKQRSIATLKKIYPMFIIGAIFIIPFLIWDFKAFWDDIFLYPSGKIETSFPIFGFGFSQLMLIAKIGIETRWDYFPFWILQLITSGPLLYYLYRYQKRNNTISAMLVSYGVFVFVFWLFSRFFNDSYIVYIVSIFIIAYFYNENDNSPINKSLNDE